MSRLASLSPEAIKAMFAPETDATLIMLVTIYDPASPTGEVALRLADNYLTRISESDAEVVYGVVSGGQSYVFVPMEVSLPTEQTDGSSSCSVTINYVTPEAVQLIRTQLTGPTRIKLDLVLSTSPNTVEASYVGLWITSATYSAESIRFELNPINFNTEPFPAHNFTPNYFPGLF